MSMRPHFCHLDVNAWIGQLTTIIANIGPIKANIVPCLVGNQHLRDGHMYSVQQLELGTL